MIVDDLSQPFERAEEHVLIDRGIRLRICFGDLQQLCVGRKQQRIRTFQCRAGQR